MGGSRANPVQLQTVEDWVLEAHHAYHRPPLVFDPFQAVGMAQRLERRGLRCEAFTFSSGSVGRLASTLYRLLRDRRLALPDDPELLDELANVRLREMSPGVYRMDYDPDKHDDRAIALALAANRLLEAPSGQGGWSPGRSPPPADGHRPPTEQARRGQSMTTTDDQARGVLSADGANRTKALAKCRGIIRDYNAAVERILADRKWTAQAKREDISRRHQAVLRQREELRREHYAELERRRVELHQAAFGPRRQADRDAWRAAAASATSLEDQDRALVSLTVARKAGDELWARALGATAIERGWDKVVEAYLAAYPDAREAVTELAAVGSVARRFEDDMAFRRRWCRRSRIGGRPSWRPNAAPAGMGRTSPAG